MKTMRGSLLCFALFIFEAQAALPPGYEDKLLCQEGWCKRRKNDPRLEMMAGPVSMFNECFNAASGETEDVTTWGENEGQKPLKKLRTRGYHEEGCPEQDDALKEGDMCYQHLEMGPDSANVYRSDECPEGTWCVENHNNNNSFIIGVGFDSPARYCKNEFSSKQDCNAAHPCTEPGFTCVPMPRQGSATTSIGGSSGGEAGMCCPKGFSLNSNYGCYWKEEEDCSMPCPMMAMARCSDGSDPAWVAGPNGGPNGPECCDRYECQVKDEEGCPGHMPVMACAMLEQPCKDAVFVEDKDPCTYDCGEWDTSKCTDQWCDGAMMACDQSQPPCNGAKWMEDDDPCTDGCGQWVGCGNPSDCSGSSMDQVEKCMCCNDSGQVFAGGSCQRDCNQVMDVGCYSSEVMCHSLCPNSREDQDPDTGKCYPSCTPDQEFEEDNGGCEKGAYCKMTGFGAFFPTGVCVPRTDDKCGENEHYEDCGSSCPRTCENRFVDMDCLAVCVEDCFCDAGYIRDAAGRCVSERECGSDGDKCSSLGESMMSCDGVCPAGTAPEAECYDEWLRMKAEDQCGCGASNYCGSMGSSYAPCDTVCDDAQEECYDQRVKMSADAACGCGFIGMEQCDYPSWNIPGAGVGSRCDNPLSSGECPWVINEDCPFYAAFPGEKCSGYHKKTREQRTWVCSGSNQWTVVDGSQTRCECPVGRRLAQAPPGECPAGYELQMAAQDMVEMDAHCEDGSAQTKMCPPIHTKWQCIDAAGHVCDFNSAGEAMCLTMECSEGCDRDACCECHEGMEAWIACDVMMCPDGSMPPSIPGTCCGFEECSSKCGAQGPCCMCDDSGNEICMACELHMCPNGQEAQPKDGECCAGPDDCSDECSDHCNADPCCECHGGYEAYIDCMVLPCPNGSNPKPIPGTCCGFEECDLECSDACNDDPCCSCHDGMELMMGCAMPACPDGTSPPIIAGTCCDFDESFECGCSDSCTDNPCCSCHGGLEAWAMCAMQMCPDGSSPPPIPGTCCGFDMEKCEGEGDGCSSNNYSGQAKKKVKKGIKKVKKGIKGIKKAKKKIKKAKKKGQDYSKFERDEKKFEDMKADGESASWYMENCF